MWTIHVFIIFIFQPDAFPAHAREAHHAIIIVIIVNGFGMARFMGLIFVYKLKGMLIMRVFRNA